MAIARERDLGRYELLLELARGGMAELFLGRLNGAGGFAKLVAIKRILPHLAQDKQFTQMFLDEGRIAARLSHPNVCQVFELGEIDGQLFLAMEYLEGVALDQLILASPGYRPEPRLLAGILAQAAEGLHYAHSLRDHTGRPTPVVHRDVSPQNLFVTVDGVTKVLDFGVSKITTDPSRTKSGVIKGKLPYMAPEQIRGDDLDGRADVFALGVCAWEALAGERLFDRTSDYLTWQAITEEPVPSLAAKTSLPPAAIAVVHRALGRTPAERQASAQVFADELRAALGFASTAEIAAAIRTTCAARLTARAQQVSQALAANQPGVVAPRTNAGATLDIRPPSVSMELREHSALVERPTVPSQPAVASSFGATPMPAPPTAVAPSAFGGVTPMPPTAASPFGGVTPMPASGPTTAPAYPSSAPLHAPVPPTKSRGVAILVSVAVIAAALAVVITVLALRRGEAPREAPRDAVVAEQPDGASDNFGLDRLDELKKLDKLRDLGKLRKGLEDMRDELHGDKPAPETTGTLKLTAEPKATIFEGDTELGPTPLDISLPVGTHTFRVVYEDGRERTSTIEIRAGKTTREKLSTW